MKIRSISVLFLAGSLSLALHGQVGSGWTPTNETFKVQTSGCGTVNGNTFAITCATSDPTKDRAEREYNAWSSGTHQFQGDCTIVSFPGNGVTIKQTFQENTGPWDMLAAKSSGTIYEVSNGKTIGSFTIGTSFRINTVLDATHGTVSVYFNGVYKETLTGGVVPIYDKCGTYRLDSGNGPITATWSNVLFWYGGTTNGGSPDFSLSTTPASQSVIVGAGTSFTTTVSAQNGFSGSVSFSVSGLPGGATASFSPTSVSGSGSSTLNVSTTGATPPGTYSLTVTGTSGSLTHNDTVTLVVTAPPDFSISATPTSQTVTAGTGTSYTVNIGNINGFSGSVALSASGLPSGATASFNPGSVNTIGSSTMTVNTTTGTPAGTYTITITGTSGSLVHSTTATLVVNPPPPDFTLSASPGSVTVVQGGNGTSTITVNPVSGFSGSVSLSASGLPGGVTASFNPSSTTTSSTLTLTASSTATTGTATVTVTGNSGSLTHTTTVSLTVQATTSLPPGWTDQDIGAVGLAGSASYNSGTFTVKGSGADIFTAGDQFNYVSQSISGNQTVIARVVSESGAQWYAKAGVMIRETTASNSIMATVLLTPTNGLALEVRQATGATAVNVTGWIHNILPPRWVKLVRSGTTFSGYYSADGAAWTLMASTNVTMATSATAGLAVTAHDNTALNTAALDNVSITPTSTGTTIAFEAESVTVTNSGVGTSVQTDVNSSNGQWIELMATATNQWMEFTTPTITAGTYSVSMMWKGNTTRGQLSLSVDGTASGATLDQYSATQTYPTTTFGTVTFATAGTHKVRLTVTGKNSSSTSFLLSADKFTFTAQ